MKYFDMDIDKQVFTDTPIMCVCVGGGGGGGYLHAYVQHTHHETKYRLSGLGSRGRRKKDEWSNLEF